MLTHAATLGLTPSIATACSTSSSASTPLAVRQDDRQCAAEAEVRKVDLVRHAKAVAVAMEVSAVAVASAADSNISDSYYSLYSQLIHNKSKQGIKCNTLSPVIVKDNNVIRHTLEDITNGN